MTINRAILIIFFICSYESAFSQAEDKATVNAANHFVYEELRKDNSFKLNRVTIKSELNSCELLFNYVYKDFRQKNGAIILLTGSVSSRYDKGKIPGYALKIIASEVDVSFKEKFKSLTPVYINMKLNEINFEKFKVLEFPCSNNGKCIAYGDPNLKLNLQIMNSPIFDPTIYISMSKGGQDHQFRLGELMEKEKAINEFEKFSICHAEIIEIVAKDLDEKNK